MRVTHQKKLTKEYLLNSIKSLKFSGNLLNKDELFPSENIDNNNQYISIKQYLNEPIIDKPLNTMIFYYWFCIQGFCPKTSINKLDNKKILLSSSLKNDYSNNKITKDNHDLIIKMTKNISKELVFFAINFEKTFQNVIKEEFINLNTNINNNKINPNPIQKEMEMNATVIKLEPEIVHIFPYILAFLEENIKNKEIMKIPRMQTIILYHIKAVSINKYFNLLSYMNNILELLLSLLLYSNNLNNNELIKDYISVKQEIILFINELMIKYPKFKNDLITSISFFVIPNNKTNSCLLKSLSVIKCINSFGYEYIIKYIYPYLNEIKNNVDQNIIFKYKNTIINVEKNINKIQNNNNIINNTYNNNNQIQNSLTSSQNNQNNSQSQSSIPKNTFTVPFSNDYGLPLSVSNIIDNSIMQSFYQNNFYEKTYFKIINNDNNNVKDNLISNFYIEIFNSISIILNELYEKEKEIEKQNQIKLNITQIFGEDIVKLLSNK